LGGRFQEEYTMDQAHENEMDQVEPQGDIGGDTPSGEKVVDAVQRGDMTTVEASEQLQAEARRHAAEHGPDLDTDEDGKITSGGFGAGQGMAHHSAGGRKQRGTSGGRS
jgi:hypothetical protein